MNFDTMEDFPVNGREDLIYKAADELSLYQFNAATSIINGGNA